MVDIMIQWKSAKTLLT